MKRMKRITLLLTLAAALCAAASCVENLGAGGGAINFGASTGAAATKTEYGRDATDTGEWETIKWVNTDQIRILCAQVDPQEKPYNITPAASTPTTTSAVTPADGEALQWGTGTHYFHASYPASAPAGVTEFSHTLSPAPANSSIFKAEIPGSLAGEKWADNEYGPSMKYAYMYAATSSEANATEVNLAFQKPLVTAFRFSIYTPDSAPIPAGTKLTKVELSSASTDMAGVFQVVIASDGTLHDGPSPLGTPTKSVSLDLGTGVELSQTTECAFTLFALPVEQKELTLKLSFSDGSTRSLKLQNGGDWVRVAGRKKLRISGLGVTPSGFTGWASEPYYNPGTDPGINEVKQQNYLPGLFSVSATEKVQFSRGNLQVNFTNNGATQRSELTREWLFSENQWDAFTRPTDEEMDLIYYYEGPASLAPALQPEGTTIPLFHFGWGTAGVNLSSLSKTKFRPNDFYASDAISRVTTDEWEAEGLYCGMANPGAPNTWNGSTSFRKFDWGIHFDEDGIGDDDKYDGTTWFTMSWSQWYYVMFSRPLAVMKRGLATIVVDPVNAVSVWGLVLVPDDWQCPAGCNFLPTIEDGEDVNTYDVGTWGLMEASGAVFLPCAGERTITQLSIHSPHKIGYVSYWTSSLTRAKSTPAVALHFYDYTLTLAKHDGYDVLLSGQDASVGRCVRLVRYAPTTP